ncbi:hypothetical protein POL68_37365 [Stigmatella sp. ncwal1]|uniref:Secreted protein n=1 Tax=Stigmatella ashevillensis TaxID=2995309 RepID=A0ABT5DKK0_9BACT|nr:hypothetical protein [Stigmatella ashevillena]MDC0714194.1 hypothetical protein [Stigmatella ashevillena]
MGSVAAFILSHFRAATVSVRFGVGTTARASKWSAHIAPTFPLHLPGSRVCNGPEDTLAEGLLPIDGFEKQHILLDVRG